MSPAFYSKWQGSLLFNPLSATSHHLRASGNLLEILRRDLCKKAFPSTAETQTQVFGCFRPQYLLILPKYPL
ncbi:MAG: hypothetical protein KIC74_09020, partial [Neisseria sp.]|nr:hypothetical protein [Neisseria sp.]